MLPCEKAFIVIMIITEKTRERAFIMRSVWCSEITKVKGKDNRSKIDAS